MNVFDTKVQNIRPDPNGGRILGHVSFSIHPASIQPAATVGSPPGSPRDIAHFDCECAIPRGAASSERVRQIRAALIGDALRQARRMPGIHAGAPALAPWERGAA